MTPSSAKSSSSRSNSEYADVADLFRELLEVPEESAQFQRQRDRIVERCLPLADPSSVDVRLLRAPVRRERRL